MLHWLERIVTDSLGQYGYQAVFVLMVLESACIPIPSEVTMLFGGFLVSRGDLNFFAVAMLGTVGNLIGSWLAYWVGARGGRPLIERWGRYLFLREHELDRAHEWFERHGEAAVFVSRLLPVVRTFISLPAGVARMPFGKFTLYTFLGCLPWTFALTWAGMLLGDNWETFLRYGDPISWAIAGISILLIAWWLGRRFRARRAAGSATGSGTGTASVDGRSRDRAPATGTTPRAPEPPRPPRTGSSSSRSRPGT
jgi:membrane protein DedA with SNARE-associated domain